MSILSKIFKLKDESYMSLYSLTEKLTIVMDVKYLETTHGRTFTYLPYLITIVY